ncbi:MAG: hypothetical protein WCI04_01170 [archaeon]
MTLPEEVREQAFYLYCQQVPKAKIAELLNIGTTTLYETEKKENWQKKKVKLTGIVKKNSKNRMNEYHQKLLDSMKQLWLKSLAKGKVKVTARDIIDIIRLERLIGPEVIEELTQPKETIQEAYARYIEEREQRKKEAEANNKPAPID